MSSPPPQQQEEEQQDTFVVSATSLESGGEEDFFPPSSYLPYTYWMTAVAGASSSSSVVAHPPSMIPIGYSGGLSRLYHPSVNSSSTMHNRSLQDDEGVILTAVPTNAPISAIINKEKIFFNSCQNGKEFSHPLLRKYNHPKTC